MGFIASSFYLISSCCYDHHDSPFIREIVGACSVEVKKLTSRILGLIGEGLGLKSGYFDDELTEGVILSAHQYPPCPDPSLTLGTRVHVDANIITILLQDDVYGLQIFKDDTWIGVDPNPHAFVVNIGTFLQVHTTLYQCVLDYIDNPMILSVI